MSKKTSPSDFLTDYPYKGPDNQTPLAVVGNWVSAGGRNSHALIRDYLEAVKPPRLAAIIKANWRVQATLAELQTAAEFYAEQVLKQ